MMVDATSVSFDGTDLATAATKVVGLSIGTNDKVVTWTVGGRVVVMRYRH